VGFLDVLLGRTKPAPPNLDALFGLPGIIGYKAVNTLDSMIGHRTERHQAFGWASARIDDLANIVPARLTGLVFVLVAPRHRDAMACMIRDARRHRSINAGWPEAAMAGALGLRLAGPRTYGETRVEDSWMGSGRAEANAARVGVGEDGPEHLLELLVRRRPAPKSRSWIASPIPCLTGKPDIAARTNPGAGGGDLTTQYPQLQRLLLQRRIRFHEILLHTGRRLLDCFDRDLQRLWF